MIRTRVNTEKACYNLVVCDGLEPKDNMDYKNSTILILILIILGLGYYNYTLSNKIDGVVSQASVNAESGYNKQEDCAKQAQSFFNYYITDPAERNVDEYSNHYNSKLDKCFVLLQYPITDSNIYFSEYLFDAVEKKLYGSFTAGASLKPPLECKTLDKFCYSKDTFDTFVKTYME